jgi:hypothetical protein
MTVTIFNALLLWKKRGRGNANSFMFVSKLVPLPLFFHAKMRVCKDMHKRHRTKTPVKDGKKKESSQRARLQEAPPQRAQPKIGLQRNCVR